MKRILLAIRGFFKKIYLTIFVENRYIKKRVEKYHEYMKSRIEFEKTPTIICTNCVGGLIYHNLGLQFMSPTINLTIKNADFIKFITNFDHYLNLELVPEPATYNEGCPVGRIDDIRIIFNHYKTFAEAKEKWDERKKRIDFDNLYIMMPLGPFGTRELEIIKNIKCKRKIVFSPREIKEYDFVFPILKDKGKQYVGSLTHIGNDGFRVYEKEFDYVAWLNGEENYRTKYFKKYGSKQ